MAVSRRDFIKVFGMSLASSILAGCQIFKGPPKPTPTLTEEVIYQKIRRLWLRFDSLTNNTRSGLNRRNDDDWNPMGTRWSTEHRTWLDALVAQGRIDPSVADLVQEAYEAAIYHVWRLGASITCYMVSGPGYGVSSADSVVEQSKALEEIAEQGTVEPATLAQIRTALEYDLAFYALTDEEEDALYDQIQKAYDENGQPFPIFDELGLEVSSEAQAAAQFLIELLSYKE